MTGPRILHQQTLTPLMSGPGNEALSGVPPAKTALEIFRRSVSITILLKVRQETNERLYPSGWMFLFTIYRSAKGPMGAYVPDKSTSAEAAASNIMMV